MLSDSIWSLINKQPGADAIDPKLLEALGAEYSKAVTELVTPFSDSESVLSPSNAGKCVRANAARYGKLWVPEPMSPRGHLTFMFGKLLESTYRFLGRTSGVEMIANNLELMTNIGGKKTRGFVDDIIKTPKGYRILWECKSMSGLSYKRVVNSGFDDSSGYLTQVALYVRQCLEDNLIDKPGWVVIFCINKDTGHLHEEAIKWSGTSRVPGGLAPYADKADEHYHIVQDAINTATIPKRPYGLSKQGNLQWQCGYCRYKWDCWTDGKVASFSYNNENATYMPEWEQEPAKCKLVIEFEKDRHGSPKPVLTPMEV